MVSINLSLSESLEEFIDERVAEAGLQSREQYVERLLRAEQRRLAKEKLDAMLLAGLDSEPLELTPEYWEQQKAELVARHAKKRNGGDG